MKKYRMLTAGERTIKGDECNYGHGFEDMSHEEGYIVPAPDEGYVRRPVSYEGKVAFLVTYSPTIRVVIDTTGLTDEQIDDKLAQAAKAEFCYNHAEHMNNFGENIDWGQTKEDTEVPFVEPEPKIPGKYRMLEVGELLENGDEYELSNGRFVPVLCIPEAGARQLSGIRYRRPIIEPQKKNAYDSEGNPIFKESVMPRYRPFAEGDTIEEGDQFRFSEKSEWTNLSSPLPKQIDQSIIDSPDFRKLIK